jgi:hypothetical protein
MGTIARGNTAEAAVLHALTAAEIVVLLPFGGGLPFDLGAVLPDGTIVRIQVKSGRLRSNCIEFNTCSSDHGYGRQDYRGRADLFAVHVDETGAIFVVPVDDTPSYRGHLRVVPAKNQQRRGIRMAEDYAFERWVAGLA